ncbi:unnamed protein product [Sphagnum tenellum]
MQLTSLLSFVPSRYVRFAIIHALLTVGVTFASVHFLPPLEPDTPFRDPLRAWGRNLTGRLEEIEDHLVLVEDKLDHADVARQTVARKTWEKIEEFKRHQQRIDELIQELESRSASVHLKYGVTKETMEWLSSVAYICNWVFLISALIILALNWPRRAARYNRPIYMAGVLALLLQGADATADARAKAYLHLPSAAYPGISGLEVKNLQTRFVTDWLNSQQENVNSCAHSSSPNAIKLALVGSLCASLPSSSCAAAGALLLLQGADADLCVWDHDRGRCANGRESLGAPGEPGNWSLWSGKQRLDHLLDASSAAPPAYRLPSLAKLALIGGSCTLLPPGGCAAASGLMLLGETSALSCARDPITGKCWRLRPGPCSLDGVEVECGEITYSEDDRSRNDDLYIDYPYVEDNETTTAESTTTECATSLPVNILEHHLPELSSWEPSSLPSLNTTVELPDLETEHHRYLETHLSEEHREFMEKHLLRNGSAIFTSPAASGAGPVGSLAALVTIGAACARLPPGGCATLALVAMVGRANGFLDKLHHATSLAAKLANLEPMSVAEKKIYDALTAQEVLFKEIGAMTTSLTWGHALFDFDLTEIDQLFDQVRASKVKILSGLKEVRNFTEMHQRRYTAMDRLWTAKLDSLEKEWETYRQVFYTHPERRARSAPNSTEPQDNDSDNQLQRDPEKRFVPLLIAAIIGGGALLGTGLGVFNTWQLSQIEKANAVQQASNKFIVNRLQLHSDALAYMSRDLVALNGTTQWLLHHVVDYIYDRQLTRFQDHLDETYALVYRETSRVMSGLDQLLGKKLSPRLVPSDVLLKALESIRQLAKKHGFTTAVEEIGFVYQLPASFLATGAGKITAFVHVPLMQPQDVMSLYHYEAIPVALANSVHSIELEPEAEFLAISSERNSFQLLSDSQIATCEKLGRLYLCPNANFKLTRTSDYCLTSLFLQRADDSSRLCATAIIPEKTVVVQQSQTAFYIFHHRSSLLTIECPGRVPEKMEFRGSKLVAVEAGCFGHSAYYSFAAHEEYTINTTVKTSQPLWRFGALLQDVPLQALELMYPEPPKAKVLLENIKEEYEAALAAVPDGWPWHLNLGLSITSTIAIVAAAASVAFCCRRRLSNAAKGLLNEPSDFSPPMIYRRGAVEIGMEPLGGAESPPPGYVERSVDAQPPHTPDPRRRSRAPRTPSLLRQAGRSSFYKHMERAARSLTDLRLGGSRGSLTSLADTDMEEMQQEKEPLTRPPREAPPPPPSRGVVHGVQSAASFTVPNAPPQPPVSGATRYDPRPEPRSPAKKTSFVAGDVTEVR